MRQILLLLTALLFLSACGGSESDGSKQESTTLPQPQIEDTSLQPPQAPKL